MYYFTALVLVTCNNPAHIQIKCHFGEAFSYIFKNLFLYNTFIVATPGNEKIVTLKFIYFCKATLRRHTQYCEKRCM